MDEILCSANFDSETNSIHGYFIDQNVKHSLKAILKIDDDEYIIYCNIFQDKLPNKFVAGAYGYKLIIPDKFRDEKEHSVKLIQISNRKVCFEKNIIFKNTSTNTENDVDNLNFQYNQENQEKISFQNNKTSYVNEKNISKCNDDEKEEFLYGYNKILLQNEELLENIADIEQKKEVARGYIENIIKEIEYNTNNNTEEKQKTEVDNTNTILPKKTISELYLLKEILDNTQKNANKNYKNTRQILNDEKLKKYIEARIDIKIIGREQNDIKILWASDESIKITSPSWMNSKDVHGKVIESICGELYLEFEIVGDGEVIISLRSFNYIGKNKQSYPIFIKYNKIKINNKIEKFDTNIVTYDKPIILKKHAKNAEIIKLDVEWTSL